MASILDAFNDACSDRYVAIKIVVYSLPVFLTSYLYSSGNISGAYAVGIPTGILLLGLLTCGIYNVKSNKHEILTFNIPFLISSIIKTVLAVAPTALVLGALGYFLITRIVIPLDYPWVQITYKSIVLILISSMIITSYLSFAKKMEITGGYNLKAIYESSVDVFIGLVYMCLQLGLINLVLAGAAFYIQHFFNISLKNPIFIFYYSMLAILNTSMIADYLAQMAYETIKSKKEDDSSILY